ncbi:2,4-dihydroxyhept-2-ene-1,7-dioic acid aldolase [Micrococcales bacterium 31B]|nr:2,4-dihydroxyhept-2-ene-1,7-dioic acid aldolase [Micrococcales bacterium 31B]
MRENALKHVIHAGGVAVNAWISTDSSYVAEVIAHAGYTSVTVDMQHGMMGRDAVVRQLQAISTSGAVPLVRPTRPDVDEIGWLLDAGAYGIIVPSVHSAEVARRVVAACFYPPLGTRSFGPSRGILYGGGDYVARVSEEITPWVMVESAAALAEIEAICAVEGLFGIYVGPNDLALDLGLPAGGRISDEITQHAKRILEVAHAHGKAVGIFCADGSEAAAFAALGFDLVTPGNDASLLRAAASERIATVRATVAPHTVEHAPTPQPAEGY